MCSGSTATVLAHESSVREAGPRNWKGAQRVELSTKGWASGLPMGAAINCVQKHQIVSALKKIQSIGDRQMAIAGLNPATISVSWASGH